VQIILLRPTGRNRINIERAQGRLEVEEFNGSARKASVPCGKKKYIAVVEKKASPLGGTLEALLPGGQEGRNEENRILILFGPEHSNHQTT